MVSAVELHITERVWKLALAEICPLSAFLVVNLKPISPLDLKENVIFLVYSGQENIE